MTFKTILTIVTDADLFAETLRHAEDLALGFDAHLDVLCLGVDRTQTGYYYAGANALVLEQTIGRATAEAQALETEVRIRLQASPVRWSVENGVAQLSDIGRHVSARARFSDLVVLPKPYGAGCGIELEPIVEAALFNGQVPVVISPTDATVKAQPRHVVIGWNQSAEALRAVRAALPVLKTAETVHVCVIDPPQHGPDRSDPGGALSQFLARHGVRAEIDVLSRTMPRISDVLMRHASDVGADLVVMGAYGHSRFREAILGGATRNMLEMANVSVFLAH